MSSTELSSRFEISLFYFATDKRRNQFKDDNDNVPVNPRNKVSSADYCLLSIMHAFKTSAYLIVF